MTRQRSLKAIVIAPIALTVAVVALVLTFAVPRDRDQGREIVRGAFENTLHVVRYDNVDDIWRWAERTGKLRHAAPAH